MSHLLNNIGTPEVVVVALVLFFLFGGRKMPELAKGVAQSIREVKGATKE